jgi:Domain of unknown function (DUF1937)
MIYLASPFTSKQSNPMDARHEERVRAIEAARYAAKLWAYLEIPVYSPIAHGFALEPFMTIEHKQDHDRWMIHCYQMLERCKEMYVLCIDGWRESKGVQLEIARALELGLTIMFLHPNASAVIDSREYAPS